MEERVEIRVHFPEAQPTLVYFPGLHGDWTLIGAFREALRGRVRFVEMAYPRTLKWSMEDHAAAVEKALASIGISEAWLLGESFGSQIIWPILQHKRLRAQGVIMAGGFVRHPSIRAVRLAYRIAGAISFALLVRILLGYARMARFRFRHSPETQKSIDDFIARRTPLDQQAAKHRLELLMTFDPCPVARQTSVPIFGISGLFDPVVPWIWVRR